MHFFLNKKLFFLKKNKIIFFTCLQLTASSERNLCGVGYWKNGDRRLVASS